MKTFFVLVASLITSVFSFAKTPNTTLVITTPTNRIVYQRNNNSALIPVQGNCPEDATAILARLVEIAPGQGATTRWKVIDAAPLNGKFAGTFKANGGWYKLEVKAVNKREELAITEVAHVGVGEVFLVVGHSVAQGGEINIEGATDDRVNTVLLDEKLKVFDSLYLTTGDPKYLPDPVFTAAITGVAQAPFGHHNYFWSKFAELVAKKENVPVLIYNAGFGGTSLEHWYKSSQNIQFAHGFVRSNIRMPYINVLNAFKKYIPLTGLRALLADQGANDTGQKNADSIFYYYKIFMQQARTDLNDPTLAIVVNRQTPANAPAVRQAQERMAKEPYSFTGPDYDYFAKEDRYDGIHLSLSGEEKAAQMWADALTKSFFKKTTPYIPKWTLNK